MAHESGIDTPSADDLVRLDRKRKGKKLSNAGWESPTDPDAKVARMKNGSTRLGMIRIIQAATIAAIVTTAANADQGTSAGWRRITDAHGSSLDVPIALVRREREPSSLVFVGDDGTRITFETITESRPGFPGNDPESDMALKRSDCTVWPPAYRVVKARVAAYSCVRDSAIVYYAARYNGFGSVVLRAAYPKGRATVWDKAVARMSASMKQLERTERRP